MGGYLHISLHWPMALSGAPLDREPALHLSAFLFLWERSFRRTGRLFAYSIYICAFFWGRRWGWDGKAVCLAEYLKRTKWSCHSVEQVVRRKLKKLPIQSICLEWMLSSIAAAGCSVRTYAMHDGFLHAEAARLQHNMLGKTSPSIERYCVARPPEKTYPYPADSHGTYMASHSKPTTASACEAVRWSMWYAVFFTGTPIDADYSFVIARLVNGELLIAWRRLCCV